MEMRVITNREKTGGICMKNSIRLVAIVTLFVMVWLVGMVSPPAAYACSCAEIPSALQQKDKMDAVFTGKAVVVKEKGLSMLRTSESPVEVSFEVDKVWKGHVSPRLTISTSLDEASCGVEFNQGNEYLVYAYASEGKLKSDLCSGTTLLTNAGNDLVLLGDASIPPAPLENVQESSMEWLIGGIVAVVLLGGVLFYFLSRRKSKINKTIR